MKPVATAAALGEHLKKARLDCGLRQRDVGGGRKFAETPMRGARLVGDPHNPKPGRENSVSHLCLSEWARRSR